jgi:phosphatidylethanolamine N-methyltransferase
MQKLYGRHLRQDAGLVRSLKRSLPPPLRLWQDGVDKAFGETFDLVEDFLDAAKPKLANGVNTIVKDTKDLFHKYPARLSIIRVESEVVGFDPKDYRLDIEGTASAPLAASQQSSDKEAIAARHPQQRTNGYEMLVFQYGAPIKVKWTAPKNHSKMDWVGLYMIADSDSRDATRVPSSGRWIATNTGAYDSATSEVGQMTSDMALSDQALPHSQGQLSDLVTGDMLFSGDKLWWTQGVFEFRYHHNAMHNVMAISLPFEVRIPHFDDNDLDKLGSGTSLSSPTSSHDESLIRSAIETAILPIVQNCFDQDPEIAPRTVNESFGSLVERDGKYTKRVVYALQAMFGIEFAPEVVQADGKVVNLSWRIWEAKKVLVCTTVSVLRSLNTFSANVAPRRRIVCFAREAQVHPPKTTVDGGSYSAL